MNKLSSATNIRGDTSYLLMLADWERDTLPELPPAVDYAEYERRVAAAQGNGMLTRLPDPVGVP